jgi:hypothetical protein
MANPTQIYVDDKRLRRKLNRVQFTVQNGSKEIRKVLRKSAKPWPEAINGGKVYKKITRETGDSTDPIGLQTWYAKVKMEYGVKARPVPPRKGSNNAGWRVHFFATPARRIRRSKRIPFNAWYRPKTGRVLRNTSQGLGNMFKRLFIR